jgi:Flp pilus assembly protein TadD
LKPDYAAAHNSLCVVLGDEGKYDDAIAQCNDTLRLDPNNAAAHNNLGFALNEVGKHNDAIAQCKQALQLKPDLCRSALRSWCCIQ